MAGALGLKLAGPRVYGGVTVEDAFMGDGRRSATERDIRRALRLYRAACAIQIARLCALRRAAHRASLRRRSRSRWAAEMRGELVERRLDIVLIGNARARRRRSRRAAPRAGADPKRARAHRRPCTRPSADIAPSVAAIIEAQHGPRGVGPGR